MFEEYHEMINVDMNRVCFFDEDDDIALFLLPPPRDQDSLRERDKKENLLSF